MKKITFTVDAQTLVGNILFPESLKSKNPALLFLHGWKSSQGRHIERAKKLVALGFICMTFDLKSHGKSDGDRSMLSIKDYLDDVIAAYDFLKMQKHVDPDRIGIVGSSFGGYLGSLLTEKCPVKWLALQAPANYPERI
ncbi:MAG TPA: alpha/beta fold hydrolase [Candidatus Saccharimonadales bacterium]|nr:alpha/beta fold hydrolase [Candidatus Saccharimonadales bacterium]